MSLESLWSGVGALRRDLRATETEPRESGGGTRNPVLVQMLQSLFNPIPVRTHEDIGLEAPRRRRERDAIAAAE